MIQNTFPLSAIQAGLLYESVLADRPWVNLEQIICHFDGEQLDLSVMTQAWRDLAARHDILRTSLHWEGLEKPEQRIAATVDLAIEALDLSEHRKVEQSGRFEQWIAQDREAGIDLTQSRSWRLTWVNLADARSALVFTFHHALLDGYSFTTLLAEVFATYDALRTGKPAPQHPAPVPFFNHVNALETADHSESRKYYTDLLQGFEIPNTVTLGDTPTQKSGRKKIIDQIMPASFGAALQNRAKAGDTTVASMVLSAWGLVVARCSGQSDAVFGVTRAGRHVVPGAEHIYGCLINTIPLRAHTDARQSIDTYLSDMRQQQVALRAHEHASLTDIAGWSDVPNTTPLFETSVMFDRHSLHHGMAARGADTETRRFEVREEGAMPLTLAVYQDDTMSFRLEYDTDRYSHATAQRLLSYQLTLLQNIVDLPGDTPLNALQMLPQGELADLVTLAGPASYPEVNTNLAEAFERQATRRRNVPAITVMGSPAQVTYAELNRRSNQLAHLLHDDGVNPGDLVALFLPRSTDFVIAMLAIIKAGAAFLPIDPSYPRTSVDHMLTDSGAIAVISNADHADALGRNNVILIDDRTNAEVYPNETPDIPAPAPDRAAYVIYTSGSTGTPKGVVISHRALAHHIQSIQSALSLDRTDQVLQFASLSFDVAIEEILPTLLAGAELVLRNDPLVEAISRFLESVDEFSLTVLNLPTAFWTALVDHMAMTGAKLPSSVRLVVVGGEAISRAVLDRFLAMAPGVRCLNGYGPTEVTITSTLFDTAALADMDASDDVPIGQPLPHVNAFICANDGSLLPRGAKGELVLAGPSVSKGYLNRPDMTADRFVTAPLSDTDRAYRTGDIVSWRTDGHIAYRGRDDRQVKVNGFRIELREVERAIEACTGVAQAVALVDNKGTSQAQLIAWAQPKSDAANLAKHDLCLELRSRLPAHLRPTLMLVDDFAITPGGKIDIAALPRPAKKSAPMAPIDSGDATVETLRYLFSDVLGSNDVTPDASFYDLGGHSLLAVRLIGQVEQQFGQRLSLAALRNDPTPKGIATALNGGTTTAPPDYVVPIQPNGSLPPIYGVHVLGKNECFFRPLAERLGQDQPLFGLSVGLLTPDALIGVEETAQAYFEQIQSHCPTGPVNLAAVSQGSFIAYELAQLLTTAGREVATLSLFDAAGPAGRPSVKGAAWLKTHMELLRRTGPEYIGQVATNRFNTLRNKFEKSRVKRAQKSGSNALDVPSTKTFEAANTLAIENYAASPYPKKLTVFRAKASVFDTEDAIRNGLGWKPVAQGGFDLIEVPGGHMSMLEAPYVDELAQKLTDVIANSAAH